jgi:hypothetical protein
MTKYVEWVEPHYGPEELPVDVFLRCTIAHAINFARNTAEKLGHSYASDEDALDDFIVTHWAEIKEYD